LKRLLSHKSMYKFTKVMKLNITSEFTSQGISI